MAVAFSTSPSGFRIAVFKPECTILSEYSEVGGPPFISMKAAQWRMKPKRPISQSYISIHFLGTKARKLKLFGTGCFFHVR